LKAACGRGIDAQVAGAPERSSLLREGLREAAEFFGSPLPLEQLHRLISLRVVGVELEVEPGAIEAAIAAGRAAMEGSDERLRAVELEVEQARYQAERSFRQYDVSDPRIGR
jgi:hypothetical protein